MPALKARSEAESMSTTDESGVRCRLGNSVCDLAQHHPIEGVEHLGAVQRDPIHRTFLGAENCGWLGHVVSLEVSVP